MKEATHRTMITRWCLVWHSDRGRVFIYDEAGAGPEIINAVMFHGINPALDYKEKWWSNHKRDIRPASINMVVEEI